MPNELSPVTKAICYGLGFFPLLFFDFTRPIMLKINAGGKNKINVNRVVFTAEITAKIIPRRDHTLNRLSEIPSIIFSFLSSSMINIDKYII